MKQLFFACLAISLSCSMTARSMFPTQQTQNSTYHWTMLNQGLGVTGLMSGLMLAVYHENYAMIKNIDQKFPHFNHILAENPIETLNTVFGPSRSEHDILLKNIVLKRYRSGQYAYQQIPRYKKLMIGSCVAYVASEVTRNVYQYVDTKKLLSNAEDNPFENRFTNYYL